MTIRVTCYAILTGVREGRKFKAHELDQICHDAEEAEREADDLEAMGCDVEVQSFTDEADVYDWCEANDVHC